MPPTITWLHLSDLHLCAPKTGWDADKTLKHLREDLAKMAQDHALKPNFLQVTGDLAFGHLGAGDLSLQAQFEDVALFLQEVCNVFDPPIATNHVFLTPGNHDVDRGKVLGSQTDYLDALSAGDYAQSCKTVNELLRDAQGEWPKLMERLHAYTDFLREYYPHLLQDEKRLCYAHHLEIKDCRIGIIGLNSAWSCGRDQEKGQLWMGGYWQLRTQLKALNAVKKPDITLAMTHHPLAWLVAQESPAFELELQQNTDFFLHGHEHQAWVEEKPQHIRLAAGACYGDTPAQSGYSFVRLHPTAGQGEVWLRRFSDEGLGWIPRVIPNRTDNNGLWPLDLAWLKAQATPPPDPVVCEKDAADTDEAPQARTFAPNAPESQGVFGRTQEIQRLCDALQEKPVLCLHGIAGIGKTQLIQEICRHLPDSPVYVTINATTHTNADELFQFLAPSLGCHDETPKLPRNLLQQLETAELKQYAHAQACVIHVHRAQALLDAAGFVDSEVGRLIRGLLKYLPHWRVVLESTKQVPKDLLPKKLCQIERVRGLDWSAVQDYLQAPFGRQDTRGWRLKDSEAQTLYERLGGQDKKTGAHPLGMALLASVADGLGRSPLQVVQDYPLEFYKSFEQRLFNDLYEHVLSPSWQHLLRLCCLYRQPIPDRHVEVLLQQVGDESAFRGLIQRFLLSPDERQEHYTLHSLFATLAEQRLKTGITLQSDHSVIADAWMSQVGAGQWRSLPRMLAANEAAHHLLLAEDFHRLRELSTSLLGWDTPFKLEQWSQRLFERGQSENQRYVLELLVKLDPENQKAHRFLGERIEKLDGRGVDAALKHHLRAFEINNAFAPCLANVGRCLFKRKEYARFVDLVDQLDPYNRDKAVNAHVHDIYSRCLENLGQGEKASQHRRNLIREQKGDAAIYNDEACYLHKANRFTAALAILQQADQAGVMDDHSLSIKAGILQDNQQGEQASQLRQAQIQAKTTNPVFYCDEALYQWREQNNLSEALAVLTLAEQADCTNTHHVAIKAKLLEALHRGAEASDLRRTQIDAGIRDAALYHDEAVYLREQGDYAAALAVLALAKQAGCADDAIDTLRHNIKKRQHAAETDAAQQAPVIHATPQQNEAVSTMPNPQNTLRWLHLSDFHIGQDQHGQERLFEYILEHVQSMSQPLDFIFITGDIAYSGQAAQYQLFQEKFVTPLKACIAPSTVWLMVPGNHDVDRDRVKRVDRTSLLADKNAVFEPTESGLSERQWLLGGLTHYQQHIQAPEQDWLASEQGAFHWLSEFHGVAVGIVGLNTAWLSKDEDDKTHLTPGKALVEDALGKIQHCSVKIVLGHHPIDWWIASDQEPIKALFRKHHVLYLHGHQHANRVDREPEFLTLQAGAAFQAREQDERKNTLLWGAVDVTQRRIALAPYTWADQHQSWVLDGAAYHPQFKVGDEWVFPLPG